MTDKDDALLEDLFEDARAADASVSDNLMARVLTDAAMTPLNVTKPASLWSGLMDALGGWPALGGVAVAGVTGLWLGLAPPSSVEMIAADVLGTTTSISFMGGFDDFVEGGLSDG